MSFLAWIGRNAKNLNLTLTRVTEVSNHVPGFCDFHVEICVRGQAFVGRGRGWSQDEALRKACGEVLERAVFGLSAGPKNNTNGWALGLTKEEAKNRAVAELVERDAFLCHYYTGMPFFAANSPGYSLFASYLGYIESAGIEVAVGGMRTINGMPAICVSAFGEKAETPFGTIIGLGCAETRQQAKDKALIECLTHLSAVLNGKSLPMSLVGFRSLPIVRPEDHGRLALSLESVPFVRPLFHFASAAEPKKASSIPVEVTFVDLPEELRDAPVFICRATSSSLQHLSFGKTNRQNMERLLHFCGGAVGHIESFPHPLA